MKIYTGTGDRGKTSLFSGERISKNDSRIEAYGVVDELNAIIGAIAASIPEGQGSDAIAGQLIQIQKDLFRVGALLATTADSTSMAHLHPMQEEDGRWLEKQVDMLQASLPELTSFILPGGHISASWAHVARTVCRRAERRIVTLLEVSAQDDDQAKNLLTYINRLSDYLFVLARYCNHLAGVDDQIWLS
ncbi:MAG: cob(I)yrinic acid a,c-diamide adenosyltransferase [Desulfocapsaceae bacterium]|nr:cob(I)yrinic acid a,c-diamide adenosyltransferase [Desulfocapsaceae bacterium]